MSKSKRSNFDWDSLILQYRQSGLSLNKWCADMNVSHSAMNYHLYTVKSRNKRKLELDNNNSSMLKLVPVKPCCDTDSNILITLGKATIRVDNNTDLNLLARLIGVINHD